MNRDKLECSISSQLPYESFLVIAERFLNVKMKNEERNYHK